LFSFVQENLDSYLEEMGYDDISDTDYLMTIEHIVTDIGNKANIKGDLLTPKRRGIPEEIIIDDSLEEEDML